MPKSDVRKASFRPLEGFKVIQRGDHGGVRGMAGSFRPLAGFKVIQLIAIFQLYRQIETFPFPRGVQGYPTSWRG